ncbi:MAG TPA: hypothetical protein VGS22_23805 [Thermoanaerobaculia bacterium]|jgi:hypothetical protein|nr:hypothetical protein [Thermoanaerobaculia bacterium]
MPRTRALALSCLALLAAPALAEVRYVPVPMYGAGTIKILVEYARTSTTPKRVDVTRIPEGVSGLGIVATRQQVEIGPSTSTKFPLLNITPGAPGLVVVNAEPGLTANEVSMEAGKAPTNSAWELPLLSPETAFHADAFAFVQNLTKTADGGSNLSLFNLSGIAATCRYQILRPNNTVLAERTDIAVPAIGAVRFDNVLATAPVGVGYVGAVTCDQTFYAIGAFPSTDRTRVRTYYPVTAFPTVGIATTLIDRRGLFLNVFPGNSFLRLPVPLQTAASGPGPRYKSLTIDFDARTADPQGFTVIRNLVGFLRNGGRRFKKTLFFGNFDRLDAIGGPKMILDVGTPYIETTIKRLLNLSGTPKNLHFHIELNADQKLMVYQIFNSNNAALFNISSSLFNDDLNAVGADLPTLEFGLPGVADDAYFPPYGWRFSNLKVIGRK